jgi:hypothetical protein
VRRQGGVRTLIWKNAEQKDQICGNFPQGERLTRGVGRERELIQPMQMGTNKLSIPDSAENLHAALAPLLQTARCLLFSVCSRRVRAPFPHAKDFFSRINSKDLTL